MAFAVKLDLTNPLIHIKLQKVDQYHELPLALQKVPNGYRLLMVRRDTNSQHVFVPEDADDVTQRRLYLNTYMDCSGELVDAYWIPQGLADTAPRA